MCPERSFCFARPRCGAGVLCLGYPMASLVAVILDAVYSTALQSHVAGLQSARLIDSSCCGLFSRFQTFCHQTVTNINRITLYF